ncbi:hypothetical protein [Streptomyces sp. NPDC058424]|uniref:hypothetical protein n=1 Tax=Streptomyces sp. NPDC058424 TaxID=3346491 RepID=UPI00364AB2D6
MCADLIGVEEGLRRRGVGGLAVVLHEHPARPHDPLGSATGHRAGYWIAGFFLLSTVFRPAGAWFAQLRKRLGTLLKDVTFPRDDVVRLREGMEHMDRGVKVLEEKTEEQYRALAELRRAVDALGVSLYGRADEADRRIAALAREFETTVNRLTDNEEIITGLKAFLRTGDASTLGGASADA